MVCFLADRCQTSSNKPKLWKYVKHVLLKRALCEATLTATPDNMIARSSALALHPAVLTYWDVEEYNTLTSVDVVEEYYIEESVDELEEYNVTATMPAVAASTKAVTSTATREKQ